VGYQAACQLSSCSCSSNTSHQVAASVFDGQQPVQQWQQQAWQIGSRMLMGQVGIWVMVETAAVAQGI